MRPVGRLRPYTVEEMKRGVTCAGCGGRAVHQWDCCANDHRKIPVCLDCDFALNEVALAFFRVKRRDRMMAKYRRRELRKA